MAPQVRVDELLPIPRDGPAPLYVQAADRVRAMIEHYSLGVGDLLPTIEQLCEAFDVSRQTITKALDSLEFEGVINRVQGKGILVRAVKLDTPFDTLIGFSEGMQRKGVRTRTTVLGTRVIQPTDELRATFDATYSAPSQYLEFTRLRFVGDIPVVLVTSVVPPVLGERMRTMNLTDTSFYRTFAALTGRKVGREDHTIALRFVTADEARCLEVKRGSPHFLVEGETYLVDGRPVERSRSIFRSDTFRFRVRSFDFTGV